MGCVASSTRLISDFGRSLWLLGAEETRGQGGSGEGRGQCGTRRGGVPPTPDSPPGLGRPPRCSLCPFGYSADATSWAGRRCPYAGPDGGGDTAFEPRFCAKPWGHGHELVRRHRVLSLVDLPVHLSLVGNAWVSVSRLPTPQAEWASPGLAVLASDRGGLPSLPRPAGHPVHQRRGVQPLPGVLLRGQGDRPPAGRVPLHRGRGHGD